MWVYHSSIGPLYIVPTGDGLFGFLYNGIIWEACPTPQIEADNVYCRATGCPDASNLEELPHDLSEWTRSEERRVGKECLRLCRSRWSPYH